MIFRDIFMNTEAEYLVLTESSYVMNTGTRQLVLQYLLRMTYFIRRTLAYLLDCLIAYSAVMLFIQWALLSQFREQLGITDDWFRLSSHMQLYVFLTISIPVWSYFALMDSRLSRGTFGKRVFRLKVVQESGSRSPGIGRSYFRTFLKLLPWEIAHLGVIYPTPLYFENEAQLRVGTYAGIVLLLIYIVSVMISRKGQSMYDRLLGINVISYG